MESDKRSREELLLRIKELELLLGKNRHLTIQSDEIFETPEFTDFFNLARDGKIIANEAGIIIGWNKAIEMISGIKAEDALGKYIWDIKYTLTPPEERTNELLKNLELRIKNAFQNPELIQDQIHEFQINNFRNEIRYLEDHSTFIIHEHHKYFLSIIRDITEQRAYDEAIKASEERHRGLLNNLELGILVYSGKGEIIFANPKATAWFEIQKYPEKNLFRFKKEIEFLTENSKVIGFENCPARFILQKKESIRNSLIGCRQIDESEIKWYILNAYPQLNEQGNIQEVVVSLLDITDRRKMVEALHIKNVALDSSILPIGTTNIHGNLNYVNPTMVKQWGFEHRNEMIGQSAMNFWEHPEKVKVFIEEAIKNGSVQGELIGKKKDGSLFPAACKISTIHDEHNQFLGLVGSFEDLSELKKSQQTLKESEEKFKSIANYSASWEGWFNLNGDLVWMNQNSIQLTGFTTEEYMASDNFLDMCIYKEDLPAVTELFIGALQGSSGENLEIRCNKKDGGIIWLSISWRPIYNSDGQSIGFRTSSQDITEKIKAKQELEKSKKQYDNLVANIDVGVFILHGNEDNCFRFEYVSPKFAEIVGCEIKDILDESTRAFRTIHPDDWSNFIQANHTANENKTILDWEGRILVNDVIRWIHIISKPDIQETGAVIWNGLLIDISEMKKTQEEIANTNQQLLKVISEKDKFFSIIAHDLRNPFNAFLGLTKLMVEDLSDLSREEIHEFAMAMSVSASNLHKLLENLLEWSRLQRGVTAFDPKQFFVKTQIEEIVKLHIEVASKKNIKIKLSIPEDIITRADANMFSSTVRNLLNNSIKFTPKGGEITIEAKEDEIYGLVVMIKDNGIGMKQETLNKLFKIDEHVNRPGTDGEPSTGLGLILCKDFIEKHHGKIWVESEEQKGSTFYFSIPKIGIIS